jgi:hypothetical protein
MLRTSVEGVFHIVQAVLPSMRERGWGRIVMLSSDRAEQEGGFPEVRNPGIRLGLDPPVSKAPPACCASGEGGPSASPVRFVGIWDAHVKGWRRPCTGSVTVPIILRTSSAAGSRKSVSCILRTRGSVGPGPPDDSRDTGPGTRTLLRRRTKMCGGTEGARGRLLRAVAPSKSGRGLRHLAASGRSSPVSGVPHEAHMVPKLLTSGATASARC